VLLTGAWAEHRRSPWMWGQGRAEYHRSPWKGDGPQRSSNARWHFALHGGRLNAEPVYQSESFPESPAIHVAVLSDVDANAFRWVGIGAEEEGVPCREAMGQEDPVATAYAAAQESRLGVGVAVGQGRVFLHEAHMPAERPVWEFSLAGDLRQACRLAGCNAGRMVKRMPLRFEQESTLHTREEMPGAGSRAVLPEMTASETPIPGAQANVAELAAIVTSIVRSLQERGIV
jgi:hypothetical protein